MKRLVSAFLAGAMALSLAACGGAASTSTAASSAAASASAAPASSAVADSDLAYIQSNGKMVVGYTVYEPMNYTDADGSFTGFDTELATAVCEKLGVEPEFVEINWDTKETELAAKSIDCIWNGLTLTDDREENMACTKPYVKNAQVVVVKEGTDYTSTADLIGKTVVARDKAPPAVEGVDSEGAVVGAQTAGGGLGGVGELLQVLGGEQGAPLQVQVPGGQSGPEGPHDAGNGGPGHLPPQLPLKGAEHRVIEEGPALDHDVLA